MDLDIREVEEALSRAEEYLKTDVFRGPEEHEGGAVLVDESPTPAEDRNYMRRRSFGRPEIPVSISVPLFFLLSYLLLLVMEDLIMTITRGGGVLYCYTYLGISSIWLGGGSSRSYKRL